jgi:uncharacterized membrane protein
MKTTKEQWLDGEASPAAWVIYLAGAAIVGGITPYLIHRHSPFIWGGLAIIALIATMAVYASVSRPKN